MRKRGRTDANQSEIVEAMRAFGASVWITSNLGDGAPDLVVGMGLNNVLVEVKDGSKSPSCWKLTPDEQAFRTSWKGWYEVVHSVDEALQLCRRLRMIG